MWVSSSMQGWIYIVICANFLGNKYRHGEAQVHGSCSQAVAQRRQRKDECPTIDLPTQSLPARSTRLRVAC